MLSDTEALWDPPLVFLDCHMMQAGCRDYMGGASDPAYLHMVASHRRPGGHLGVDAVEIAVEKSCCRGPLQRLYTNHALSQRPQALQRSTVLQLYSTSTLYNL